MSNSLRINMDDENNVENRFQARKASSSSFGNQSKRVPLSQISTNTVRIQPTKNIKQTGGFIAVQDAENLGPGCSAYFGKSSFNMQPKGRGFTIHVDEEEDEEEGPFSRTDAAVKKAARVEDSCEKLTLHSGVTSIAIQRQPLREILQEKYTDEPDSPAALDVTFESVDGGQDHNRSSNSIENVLLLTEYSDEIYAYLREAEKRHEVKTSSYMRKQPDITPEMRSILIDWLVEVAEEFELCSETLYLSVAYIDKFLSIMSVLRSKLQLVGTACMFIASKYEEIYPRGVKDFVYITDDTYTEKQVLRMEQLIYKVLSFSMAMPTMNCFLQYYCTLIKADKQTEYLAAYMCELSMLETEPYLKFSPSVLALSALVLAAHTNEEDRVMTPEVELKTGYTMTELRECVHALYKAFTLAPSCKQQAVREKYKSSRYHEVSLLLPRDTLPC